jgi:hypothetical protein
VILSIFTGVPALIVGILGLREIRWSGGRLKGRNFALGGIVVGVAGSACLPLLAMRVMDAVQRVHEATLRTEIQ